MNQYMLKDNRTVERGRKGGREGEGRGRQGDRGGEGERGRERDLKFKVIIRHEICTTHVHRAYGDLRSTFPERRSAK